MFLLSRGAQRRSLGALVAAVSLAASTSLSSAALIAWNGSTSTGLWSTGTNWTPNTTPSVDPANPDDLTFSSVPGTRVMSNDLTGVQLHSIAVSSGLYTLATNSITFTGTNPTFTNSAGGSGSAFANNEIVTLATTLTVANNATSTRIDFNADITGTGGFTVNSSNTGVVRFAGTAKTYAGDTTVTAGTLDLVTTNSLIPSGAGKGNVSIAAGATILDENVNLDVNGLNGAGTINRNTGSNTRGLTVGNNNANGTFTGTISNAGTGAYSVTKNGTGTQSLGTITTNAGVNAAAGTLLLDGPVTAASSTVTAGATLGGTTTAILTGAFTNNGTVAPGNQAVGAMSVSTTAATFSATSTYAVEIGGNTAGSGYDQLNFTNALGTVTLNAAAALTASIVGGYTPTTGDIDYILTRADIGTYANGFAGLPEGATVAVGSYTAQITYAANWTGTDATSTLAGGNDVALYNFQSGGAVPEPASLGILALGAASLLTRRRK